MLSSLLKRSAIAITLLGALPTLAAPPSENFYRIIHGPNPGAEKAAIDRYQYGTDILYTGDATPGKPTQVKGTVWHAEMKEAEYFVGTHNPVIQQPELLEKIANDKWAEAQIMQTHAPGAFPRTENMSDVVKALDVDLSQADKAEALRLLSAKLRERYPQGFFLKPLAGFASGGTLPTEKTAFDRSYQGYTSDLLPQIERLHKRHQDPVDIHEEFRWQDHYEGRVFNDLVNDPSKVIVQEKINAVMGNPVEFGNEFLSVPEEYRIHVVEGKVLKGASMNRWADARNISRANLAKAERFIQRVMNSLPEDMKKMCFAIDVIRTQDSFKVVELNPGGDSGMLYPDYDVVATHKLAEHFTGHKTALQEEFEHFKKAKTLAEKEKILKDFYNRPEIKPLAADLEPLSEFSTQAKEIFLDEIKKDPTPKTTMKVLKIIKKFDFESLFTVADVEFMAGILQRTGKRPSEISALLRLDPKEFLLNAPSRDLKLMTGLAYDDTAIQKKLAKTVRERIQVSGVERSDEAATKRITQEVIDESVLTRRQIHEEPAKLSSLAKDMETMSAANRVLYTGSRETLMRSILKSVVR